MWYYQKNSSTPTAQLQAAILGEILQYPKYMLNQVYTRLTTRELATLEHQRYVATYMYVEYGVYYRPQCIIVHSIFSSAEQISSGLALICSMDSTKIIAKQEESAYAFPGERA